jgi:hypothetical protein
VIGGVLVVLVLLLVCGGVAVAAFFYLRADESSSSNNSPTTVAAAGPVEGLINYRELNPSALTQNHQPGRVTYPMSPPAGGDHNPSWQNCEGDVYDQPIPSERAVHSMEHGAIWVTYSPDLPSDQISALASKVRGNDYMLMSPFPGLDKPVSLQAWGYQLKVSSADHPDVDRFINNYRRTATKEPGATCGSGSTKTGTDLSAN